MDFGHLFNHAWSTPILAGLAKVDPEFAQSAVFAVEHVAHGAAAQGVDFRLDSAVDRIR